MPKRKLSTDDNGGGATNVEAALEKAINSNDMTGCETVRSKLKSLLDKADAKIAELKEQAKKKGLRYRGEKAVRCGCGNSFKPGGDFSAECEGDCGTERELCIECVEACGSCGKQLCKDCESDCSGCRKVYCNDCLEECCRCEEKYCGGDGDCDMISYGYRGEVSCKFCL